MRVNDRISAIYHNGETMKQYLALVEIVFDNDLTDSEYNKKFRELVEQLTLKELQDLHVLTGAIANGSDALHMFLHLFAERRKLT